MFYSARPFGTTAIIALAHHKRDTLGIQQIFLNLSLSEKSHKATPVPRDKGQDASIRYSFLSLVRKLNLTR